MADVSGDGKADAIAVGTGSIGVLLSNGSSFGSYQTWASIPFYGSQGTFFADVTGDGKADAIAVGDNYIGVLPSTGSAFGSYQTWAGIPFYGTHGATLFGDVNGDGKADAVAVGDDYVGVLLSNGSSFGSYQTWATGTFWNTSNPSKKFLADVDGDGKDDLIVSGSVWTYVYLSTGTGFSFTGAGYATEQADWITDVNGDGKADYVEWSYNATYSWYNYFRVLPASGSGFTTSETWSTLPFLGSHATLMADITGDGKGDAVAFGDGYIGVLPAN